MSSNSKCKCPYCGFAECEADWVDIGVGEVQCGPYYCPECGSSEIGGQDNVQGKRRFRGWHDLLVKRWEQIPHNEHFPKPPRPAPPRMLTDREDETGWYEPNTPAGSSVNTCQGVIVDHQTAKRLYEMGLLDAKE